MLLRTPEHARPPEEEEEEKGDDNEEETAETNDDDKCCDFHEGDRDIERERHTERTNK